MDYRPIIIFANTSNERDHLRDLLSANNSSVLCFEKETICFDNLKSIDPKAIIVKTESPSVAWRFVLAMEILGFDSTVILLSDKLNDSHFSMYGLGVNLRCLHIYSGREKLLNQLENLIAASYKNNMPLTSGLLVGHTETILRVNAMIPNLRNAVDTILISGEPGTGKELLSRVIARPKGEKNIFIKVDCAQLKSERRSIGRRAIAAPKGYIVESLQKIKVKNQPVTILLDKIEYLDHDSQSDILFLIDNQIEKKLKDANPSVRYIATSETDLHELVKTGGFRKDLYFRLNAIPVHLPPLRHRLKDVPMLIDYLSIAVCAEMKKSYIFPKYETVKQLCNYNWPGNIDEMEMRLRQFVSTGDEHFLLNMTKCDCKKTAPTQILYQTMQAMTEPNVAEIYNYSSKLGDLPLKSICEKFAYRTEKKLMKKALEATNWNRKKAAELLSISYKSMLNKMKMYEIV